MVWQQIDIVDSLIQEKIFNKMMKEIEKVK